MVGRMEKVPLREVWKKEAKDVTSWLYENLGVLGEELDLDLTRDEKEKSVGSFSADITAEDGSGRKVLIENQLEKTDHVHLGQILTNISNLEAKVAVWISSDPRPEHMQAVIVSIGIALLAVMAVIGKILFGGFGFVYYYGILFIILFIILFVPCLLFTVVIVLARRKAGVTKSRVPLASAVLIGSFVVLSTAIYFLHARRRQFDQGRVPLSQ